MKVRFQYPVFTAKGFECFLQIEADVEFSRPPLIIRGEAEDDGTDDSVGITSAMFMDDDVSNGVPIDAMPAEMLREIEEVAFDKAKKEIEEAYDYEEDYENTTY